MTKERHKVFIACYLYLQKDRKVLLLRRYNTRYQDGNYTMVSGHIDDGDTAITAMKRESMEKAGLDIDVNDLKVVHVQQRKSLDMGHIDFYLTANNWGYEPKNMEPDKCDDMQWFEINNMPKNIIGYIPKVIKNMEKGQVYSTYFEKAM